MLSYNCIISTLREDQSNLHRVPSWRRLLLGKLYIMYISRNRHIFTYIIQTKINTKRVVWRKNAVLQLYNIYITWRSVQSPSSSFMEKTSSSW